MSEPLMDGAAKILAALLSVPEADRLDVLAIAIRAALDGGVVENYRRRCPLNTP